MSQNVWGYEPPSPVSDTPREAIQYTAMETGRVESLEQRVKELEEKIEKILTYKKPSFLDFHFIKEDEKKKKMVDLMNANPFAAQMSRDIRRRRTTTESERMESKSMRPSRSGGVGADWD